VNTAHIFIDVSNAKQTDYQRGDAHRKVLLEKQVINKTLFLITHRLVFDKALFPFFNKHSPFIWAPEKLKIE
jgi:hypothetical protein